MNRKWIVWGLVLMIGALFVSGCSVAVVADEPESVEYETVEPYDSTMARDAALAYLWKHNGRSAPAVGLAWTEKNVTPEGSIGGMTYRYTAEDWTVTVSYGVVNPASVVYTVVIESQVLGVHWEGTVDAEGSVSERSDETAEWFDPICARDAVLAYISARYGEQAPSLDLVWDETNKTPGYPEKPLPGATNLQYTADNWMMTLSYPVVRPDMVEYQITIVNESAGFRWQGKVTASGEVIEQSIVTGKQPVVAWYGRVVSLPVGSQFDDYISLMPQGTGEIGVEGVNEEIEAQIVALRDKEMPGAYAHFWGTLTCDMLDYGGCQLLVTKLRVDGPGTILEPIPVKGWKGTIVSVGTVDNAPAAPQFDDIFVLAGRFPVEYGINSVDPALAAQLESLRDTGTTIRIWGELICPAIDAYGTQIAVTRIEITGESQEPVQVSAPAMARDAAMVYLTEHYRGLAPVPMPTWSEENVTSEDLVGQSTFEYRGKEWIVAVSFPLVNPAATVYQVTIANEANGFGWQGEVDATGQVTERAVSGDIESLLVDEDEWQPYYSKKFGYAFHFPGECAIVSQNLDEALQVSTATTTGEGWPCLSVTHYDSDFYHPPAGTDLQQWLIDWKIHHDEMGTDVEIAGLPAVHLRIKETKGAYAYDEYYFVKGEQLFRILIVHCGEQDWDLYNRFLSSFIFPGA